MTFEDNVELVSSTDMPVRVVILYNDKGDYVIHGSNVGTPADLFKAVSALWFFDPSKEGVHYAEFELDVPPLK